jgi:hypothetical protein
MLKASIGYLFLPAPVPVPAPVPETKSCCLLLFTFANETHAQIKQHLMQ